MSKKNLIDSAADTDQYPIDESKKKKMANSFATAMLAHYEKGEKPEPAKIVKKQSKSSDKTFEDIFNAVFSLFSPVNKTSDHKAKRYQKNLKKYESDKIIPLKKFK